VSAASAIVVSPVLACSGVAVGPRAHEVAGRHLAPDHLAVFQRVVALQEGGVGPAGLRAREQHPAGERRRPLDVPLPDLVRVVEREQHLATDLGERGPPRRQDGLLQGGCVAPHVVGGEHLVLREDGADLGVDGVEGGGVERERLGEAGGERVGDVAVLGLDEHQDGRVARVRRRPRLHLLEARRERRAGRADVDLLHVEHLQPRFAHGGGHRGRLDAEGGEEGPAREAPAGRVGEDVELDLADAELLELLADRPVGVGQGVPSSRSNPASASASAGTGSTW
jgi:hypothetical protein